MPAAMLKKNTIHMIANCDVRRYGAAGSTFSGTAAFATAGWPGAPDSGGSLRTRLLGIRMHAKTIPSQRNTT